MPRAAQDASSQPGISAPVHPVYLDIPMMVSFLAALRDGVEFENTVTRRDARTSSRDREAAGKVRLPPLASLFGLEASGKMARKSGEEASEETKVVRQHTAASLFNALHGALREDGLLVSVSDASDLADIEPGNIVETSGDFVGNPLEPVLAFFRQAAPYFDLVREPTELPDVDLSALRLEIAQAEERAQELALRARQADRSGNPAVKDRAAELREEAAEARTLVERGGELLQGAAAQQELESSMQMINQIGEDLDKTPVQDTVIKAGDLHVVLTMSREFFTDTTRAHLRAGMFQAVGKVTRVLQEGEEINLLRRTVIGAAEPKVGRDLLNTVVEDGSLQLETFDPIIKAPALQILPLAVFI